MCGRGVDCRHRARAHDTYQGSALGTYTYTPTQCSNGESESGESESEQPDAWASSR
jgi:hypothetical protein